jgi:hypothetical protein
MVNQAAAALDKPKTLKVVILATFVTLLLYFIPLLRPLAYPFLLISTLAHEMGHGIAAAMIGGHFHSFALYADASGVAQVSGDFGALGKAFVAASGLLGPALWAALSFFCVKSPRRSRVFLAFLSVLLLLSLILVVRNLFGCFFVAGLAIASGLFSFGSFKNYGHVFLAFIASQLALSVFSRSDYLFTPYAITSAGVMPSDVMQISESLFLPYWFWGALCGLFSLLVLFWGSKALFK